MDVVGSNRNIQCSLVLKASFHRECSIDFVIKSAHSFARLRLRRNPKHTTIATEVAAEETVVVIVAEVQQTHPSSLTT